MVAALDERGAELGVRTTRAGHRALLPGFGDSVRSPASGTGSYGAGLARFLHAEGVTVQNRQLAAASPPVDAVAAARAAQSMRGDPRLAGGSSLGQPITAINQMRALRQRPRRPSGDAAGQHRVQARDDCGAAPPGRPDDRGGSHPVRTARTGSASAEPRGGVQAARRPAGVTRLRHCSGARGFIRCGDGHCRRAPRLRRRQPAAPGEAAFAHLCGVAPIVPDSSRVDITSPGAPRRAAPNARSSAAVARELYRCLPRPEPA